MVNDKKFVAIIQARTGSTRLPNKALLNIEGSSMIANVIRRVKESLAHEVVLATTRKSEDDILEKIAKQEGVSCYRGSENDVLDRFYQAAKRSKADYVIRITGDQPFINWEVIDAFMFNIILNDVDFLGNKGWPDGLDIDIVKFSALQKAWKKAKLQSDREHVMPFIYHHPKMFKIKYFDCPFGDLTHERWTCDEACDYDFVKSINKELYNKNNQFGIGEVLDLLKIKPELRDVNDKLTKNEGYTKSMYMENGLKKSYEYLQRAKKVIPTLSQTLSKAPMYYPQGFSPYVLEKGDGCYVWDIDGNKYFDFVCALGPVSLGYNNKAVNKAIIDQVKKGITFSLPHRLEVELSEELLKIIPGAEMVRFAKNGSDVTSAAVRIARMHTNREHIAFCGYHGSQDWYCITTPRNQGVPSDLAKIIHKFEWNDIASLKKIFKEYPKQIAAVIFEVPAIDPLPGFLDQIKELAHKNGAVVILDEVVSQARYGPRGAAGKFNFVPDLTVCGKGFANGMPIGILAGKKEIMNELADKGFMSNTFSGEAVSLAAALATIKEMKKKNFFKHEEKIGTMFRNGFEKLTKKYNVNIKLGGNWARTIMTFNDWDNKENNKIKTLFLQEMLKNKVICLGAPFFFTLAMKEKDINFALKACDKALAVVAEAYKQKTTDGYLMCPEVGTAFTRAGSR